MFGTIVKAIVGGLVFFGLALLLIPTVGIVFGLLKKLIGAL